MKHIEKGEPTYVLTFNGTDPGADKGHILLDSDGDIDFFNNILSEYTTVDVNVFIDKRVKFIDDGLHMVMKIITKYVAERFAHNYRGDMPDIKPFIPQFLVKDLIVLRNELKLARHIEGFSHDDVVRSFMRTHTFVSDVLRNYNSLQYIDGIDVPSSWSHVLGEETNSISENGVTCGKVLGTILFHMDAVKMDYVFNLNNGSIVKRTEKGENTTDGTEADKKPEYIYSYYNSQTKRGSRGNSPETFYGTRGCGENTDITSSTTGNEINCQTHKDAYPHQGVHNVGGDCNFGSDDIGISKEDIISDIGGIGESTDGVDKKNYLDELRVHKEDGIYHKYYNKGLEDYIPVDWDSNDVTINALISGLFADKTDNLVVTSLPVPHRFSPAYMRDEELMAKVIDSNTLEIDVNILKLFAKIDNLYNSLLSKLKLDVSSCNMANKSKCDYVMTKTCEFISSLQFMLYSNPVPMVADIDKIVSNIRKLIPMICTEVLATDIRGDIEIKDVMTDIHRDFSFELTYNHIHDSKGEPVFGYVQTGDPNDELPISYTIKVCLMGVFQNDIHIITRNLAI